MFNNPNIKRSLRYYVLFIFFVIKILYKPYEKYV